MTEFLSYWRCDTDGETFTVTVAPIWLDAHGDAIGEVAGADVLLGEMPCRICHAPMRRVVSPGDLRDWGHELRPAK